MDYIKYKSDLFVSSRLVSVEDQLHPELERELLNAYSDAMRYVFKYDVLNTASLYFLKRRVREMSKSYRVNLVFEGIINNALIIKYNDRELSFPEPTNRKVLFEKCR